MENATRTKNFTSHEINILLDLVRQNADVLECKVTGKVRPDQKDKAWENLSESFNSTCSGIPRSAKTLRTKYSNLKTDMKKQSAEHKKYCYGTGGGPPRKQPVSEIDKLLSGILPERQVQGMNPNYDNDKQNKEDLDQSGFSTILSDDQYEDISSKQAMDSLMTGERNDCGAIDIDLNEQATSKKLGTSSPTEKNGFGPWEKYTSAQLKPQKNKKLCVENVNRKQTSWAKLAEIKTKWSEKTLKEELDLAKIEHTLRIKQMKESHELKQQFAIEKHSLEMQILEEQLKRTQNTSILKNTSI